MRQHLRNCVKQKLKMQTKLIFEEQQQELVLDPSPPAQVGSTEDEQLAPLLKENYLLVCEHCQFCFSSFSELELHKQEHQEEMIMFLCGNCGRSFSSRSKLAKHVECYDAVASTNTDAQCQLCGESIPNAEMSTHLKSHMSSTSVKCSSIGCNQIFPSASQLKVHAAKHQKQWLVCDFPGCSFAFNLQTTLDKHKRNSHKIRSKPKGIGKNLSNASANKLLLLLNADSHNNVNVSTKSSVHIEEIILD